MLLHHILELVSWLHIFTIFFLQENTLRNLMPMIILLPVQKELCNAYMYISVVCFYF